MAITTREAVRLPLGPADAGMPMTLDEFEAADFEPGHRYELIHGILVVTPPPLEEERDSNEELGRWLRNYQESEPQGKSMDLTLPEQNLRTMGHSRRCDRAVWARLGRGPRTRGRAARRDVPAIVVEFPSRRPADQRRDYEEKQLEYRDLGVKEYWIIDRFRRQMTVYSWQGRRWAKRVLREGEVYTTEILPGFRLDLKRLLAVADRHREADEAGGEG
ncbi:MAG: Uma2 family endonuclease [Planctomycetes bacterium]|nr:Uma2 family endonuclease [Planctomycetota bacterium]